MVAPEEKQSEFHTISSILDSIDWAGARILSIGSSGGLWLQLELASGISVYLAFTDCMCFSCNAKAFSSPLSEYVIAVRSKLVVLMAAAYGANEGISRAMVDYVEVQLWSREVLARPVITVVAAEALLQIPSTGFEIQTGDSTNLAVWEYVQQPAAERLSYPPSTEPSQYEMYEFPYPLDHIGVEDAEGVTIYASQAAISCCIELWDARHAVLACRDWLHCTCENAAGGSQNHGFAAASATPLIKQLIDESIEGTEQRQTALERYKEIQLHHEEFGHPVMSIVAGEYKLYKVGR